MGSEEFEVYPIQHNARVYNLVTPFEMTFVEVRALLGWLEGQGAFAITPEDEFMGPGKLFTCTVQGVTFEVDVQGYEVIVFGRKP
ncbi:MAG TPA: hypothetical protein VK863_08615 [Candidatus Limnocylindrales bacterium]|nr:hypothetical protein [Candidatus Limnocylindrales bacterium]